MEEMRFPKHFNFCPCQANELLMVEALISTPKSCGSTVLKCVCVCVSEVCVRCIVTV